MLPAAGPTGVTVDLLLPGYRLIGVSYQVTEKVRLSDVLSARGETVLLRHASVLSLKGQVIASLPEVTIEKSQLIAAIPKESEDYQHRQRLFRAGMTKPMLVRSPVLALVPPYAATGKVHLPPNSDLSDPAHSGLGRFFPLTDAVLFMGDDRLYQGPVVLVNRDLVAMLGRTGEDIRDQPQGMVPRQHDVLGDVIATLNQQVRQ